MKAKKVAILGATGSIGRQTVDCILSANKETPGRFMVSGLSAGRDVNALLQISQFFPDAQLALTFTEGLTSSRIPHLGAHAVSELLASIDADIVVNGISGSAGLGASAAALARGFDLALANKESVVMGWSALQRISGKTQAAIIPVDSEHASLFQLFSKINARDVIELTITASGGPFRTTPLEVLRAVTPAQAIRHPVWNMGRKISIDSATLANKGLELIEAVRLFSVPESRVSVLVHPESLVHALVRTTDGSLYAYISEPDMRLPIDLALAWPEQVPSAYGRADLAGKTLHFEKPDAERFPLLDLARAAVSLGDAATIAYNAADEIAVEAFEKGEIGFLDIAAVVARVLSSDWAFPAEDLESIFHFDEVSRSSARRAVREILR